MSRIRVVVVSQTCLLLGLATAVAIVAAVASFHDLGAVTLGPWTAVFIAAAAPLVWLAPIAHARGMRDPLVRGLALAVLLGAFVAGPAAATTLAWLTRTGPADVVGLAGFATDRLIEAFFLIAMVQELCKYLVVRYGFYSSSLLSEQLDGVILTTATALGFAAYQAHSLLLGSNYLNAAFYETAVLALGHVSASALCGYSFAAAKFFPLRRRLRALVLFSGLALAGACNGAFFSLTDAVERTEISLAPMRRVVFAFGFASIVFVAMALLIRQLLQRYRHLATNLATTPSTSDATR